MTTIVSLPQSPPLPPPRPTIRRIAVVLTSLVAGAVGCVVAYWTWRMVLRVPIGLEHDLQAAAGNVAAEGGQGTPWWVPSAIVSAVAMLLWPILTARARRISLLGGSAAIILASLLIFPMAAMCVEVTALTHSGWPSIVEIVVALPRMAIEAVKITFVNLYYCGLITVPAAALIGLLLAAFGRTMQRIVKRASAARSTNDAG